VQHVPERGFFPNAGQLGKGVDSLFDYFGAEFQECKDTDSR
jgi:hypothetical protein